MHVMKKPTFILGLTVALAACGSDSTTQPSGPPVSGRQVDATPSLAFTPASLIVHAGDAVNFVFGNVAHNVVFSTQAGAPADIGGNNAQVSVSRTFATPGVYHYTCTIHPGMAGTVTVQ